MSAESQVQQLYTRVGLSLLIACSAGVQLSQAHPAYSTLSESSPSSGSTKPTASTAQSRSTQTHHAYHCVQAKPTSAAPAVHISQNSAQSSALSPSAGSEPLRTFYGSKPVDNAQSAAGVSSDSTAKVRGLNLQKLESHLSNAVKAVESVDQHLSNIPGVGSVTPNLGTPAAGFGNYVPPAVGNSIGGHLPSAMPNPANLPLQEGAASAQEAEHQRVLNNMRAASYSEERIKALEPYIHQSDPPGTTYRNIMGIKVRNDGMTVDKALNNIKSSGLMNTPISTDPHYYQNGTYGYYRTHGGTKSYGQWLDDGQK
jgi:hypothetical protein